MVPKLSPKLSSPLGLGCLAGSRIGTARCPRFCRTGWAPGSSNPAKAFPQVQTPRHVSHPATVPSFLPPQGEGLPRPLPDADAWASLGWTAAVLRPIPGFSFPEGSRKIQTVGAGAQLLPTSPGAGPVPAAGLGPVPSGPPGEPGEAQTATRAWAHRGPGLQATESSGSGRSPPLPAHQWAPDTKWFLSR